MTTTNPKLDAVKAQIASSTFSYPKVKFPAEYKGSGIVEFKADDGTPTSYVFHKLGVGYLSERIPGAKYGDFTAAWESGDPTKRAQIIEQVNSVLGGNGKEYVLAVVDGMVLGVMTSYTPVAHTAVIAEIESHNLQNTVNSAHLGLQELTMNLVVRAIKDTKFIDEDSDNEPKVYASLRITNGHSGHSALSYYAYIAAGAYEYQSRLLSGSRRHLSKVAATFKNIQEAFDAVEETRLVYRLFDLDRDNAMNIINAAVPDPSPRQQKLLALVDSTVESGLDILSIFGEYAKTRGYMSAVKGLLDPMIEHVTEMPVISTVPVTFEDDVEPDPLEVNEGAPLPETEVKELDVKGQLNAMADEITKFFGGSVMIEDPETNKLVEVHDLAKSAIEETETPDLPGELEDVDGSYGEYLKLKADGWDDDSISELIDGPSAE